MRLFIAGGLLFGFLWPALLNWQVFWRRTILQKQGSSWIPILGGFLGVLAIRVAGVEDALRIHVASARARLRLSTRNSPRNCLARLATPQVAPVAGG